MNPSTDAARMEQLVTTMSNRIATITRALGTWVQDAPRDLQQIEQHVLRLVKGMRQISDHSLRQPERLL